MTERRGPVRQVDSTFEGKVGTAVRFTSKNLLMIESDPTVRLVALVDLLCIELVTTMPHLSEQEVRRQAFQLFRLRLNEAQRKMREARKMIEGANDK